MKTIIFVRHAKSDWGDHSLDDHDRPLNKRGRRDAPVMGARLAAQQIPVDRLISSSAVRALTTARLIAEALDADDEQLLVDPRLYLAGVSDMLEVIHELPDEMQSIMLFAHNPGMTHAANTLGGLPIDNLPTCGMFGLRFNTDRWTEVGSAEVSQLFLDFPKNVSGM